MISGIAPNVLYTIAGLYSVLLLATGLIYLVIPKLKPLKDHTELKLRVNSWWIILSVFAIAICSNRTVSLTLIAVVCFLALKEFLSIIPTRRADRRVLFWAYLSIPLQFYWIWLGWYGMFVVFIPVYVFLFLPFRMVTIGETKGFLPAAGVLHWALMLNVFSISHVAFLLTLGPENNPVGGGGPGLALFLIMLTELNDVAQFCWGKMLGRHKIIPRVSPNKTWEGFLGGMATTVLLSRFLSPLLTPLTPMDSLLVGFLISAGGFVGDVVVSAIKRDIGVKDSGSLIPGHGGILDRIDSLTYTAPIFFHFVHYFYYHV